MNHNASEKPQDRKVETAMLHNEIEDYLCGKNNLEEMKEKVSIKTRQYAKKQRTWARGHMYDWNVFDQNDVKKIIYNLN